MKKITFSVLLLSMSAVTFSQQTDPMPPLTKQDYLQRSKNEKQAAFVLLGIGGACIAIAAPGKVDLGMAGALVIGGGAAIIGSIPLFIAAGKYKRKAMSMTFKNETVPLPQAGGFTNQPALSVTIKIGL